MKTIEEIQNMSDKEIKRYLKLLQFKIIGLALLTVALLWYLIYLIYQTYLLL